MKEARHVTRLSAGDRGHVGHRHRLSLCGALGALLLFGLAGLTTPGLAVAQLWSGIVNASRVTNWQANNVGVIGGIPNRTTICTTISAYTGPTTAINTAIANCAAGGGGVVVLGAGTFTFDSGGSSGGIDFMSQTANGVTLRGQGADQTLLVFTGSWSPCSGSLTAAICIGTFTNSGNYYEVNPLAVYTWSSGYSQNATTLTLSSVAGLTVGQLIWLDQEDDAATGPTPPVAGPFVSNHASWCISGCEPQGRVTTPLRTQMQLVTITQINAGPNTIVVEPGLHRNNWASGKNPKAWTIGVNNGGYMNGVENLSIDLSYPGYLASAVIFFQASNSWVKGVRTIQTNRSAVGVNRSQHIEVRDNYFYKSKSHADQSYGIETTVGFDSLAINNIFQNVTQPELTGGGSGNVAAYNYAIYTQFDNNATQMMPAINWGHHAASAFNLDEGNSYDGANGDLLHGPSQQITLFRNRLIGQDTQPGPGHPTSDSGPYPLFIPFLARYMNVIGNVMGQVGYHDVYECSRGGVQSADASICASATTVHQHFIYGIGYVNSGDIPNDWGFTTPDSETYDTLYRWGNCDVVNYAVPKGTPRGCNFNDITGTSPTDLTNEVPSGQSTPGSHTLPASFFLASKPAFFQNIAWPPIGPDVTGGTDTDSFYGDTMGYTHLIPAKNCYLNVMHGPMDGTGSVLSFNADACYQGGSAPAPPSNLHLAGKHLKHFIEAATMISGLGWHFRRSVMASVLTLVTALQATPLLLARSHYEVRQATASALVKLIDWTRSHGGTTV